MSVRETLLSYAENLKMAIFTSVATVATGVSGVMEWIPNDFLATIATIIGIVLSLVLIYTHWRKGRSEYNKTLVETEILKAKLAEIERLNDD